MVQSLAHRAWVRDVAKPLAFQWLLLLAVTLMASMGGWLAGVNALLAGAAIAVPHTTLGAWMGVKIFMQRPSPMGVLLGGVIKTLFSIGLIGAAFAALQELGWVWQGFMAGLVSMAMSTVLYGLFGGALEKLFKKLFKSQF